MNALRNRIISSEDDDDDDEGEAAYFFTGKYDPSKLTTPYSALGSAFNQMVDQVVYLSCSAHVCPYVYIYYTE